MLLKVLALANHISPPCQSESIMTKVSSKDQLLLKVKGGHIGMMAGSGALKYTWPHIDSWLAARSDLQKSRLQSKHPLSHAVDVHLIAAVESLLAANTPD